MRVFVANVSEKRYEFMYRIPEETKVRKVTIQPRAQQRLPDDLTKEQIEYIVDHHGRYGFIPVDEVGSGSGKKRYSELCYSVDKSVSPLKMEALYRINHNILVERGKEIRKQTAIASNNKLVETIEREARGTEFSGGEIENFTTTIQEQDSKDGFGSDPINESFRVVENPGQSKIAPGRGRRK